MLLAGCSRDDGIVSGVDGDLAVSSSVATTSLGKKFNDGAAEYEVTIVNMSHSQPFSPGVIVTHDASVNVFTVGMPASDGVREIAENGNQVPAFEALNGAAGVSHVVDTGGPIFTKNGPGSDRFTATITANESAEHLSMAVMLICTNDGFIGLDSVELPKGPETAVYFPAAYDAGTEANDEMFTSIVDPCGVIGPVSAEPDGMNNRTATMENITPHPGISGSGDLDAAVHSWRNKVARVTVKRVGYGRWNGLGPATVKRPR